MIDFTAPPPGPRVRVDCAVCKAEAERYIVVSNLDPLGEELTFTVECHGAREVAEVKPLPLLPMAGPLKVTVFRGEEPAEIEQGGYKWSEQKVET